MSVRPVTDPDAVAAWRAMRDPTDPFGEPAYLDALSDVGVRLALVVGGDAATVVATSSIGPFRRAGLPPLTPYTPIVLDPADDEAAAHAGSTSMQRLADELSAVYSDVLLHLPPSVDDVRPLQWSGWTVEPRFTYRLDPSVAADPASWSSGQRRLGLRHRNEYVVVEDAALALEATRLAIRSYDRKSRPAPLPSASMERLAQRMASIGAARVFLARDAGGTPAAGLVLLSGPTACYYWIAGSVPGPAMTVLLGSVLERLAGDGVPVLDFVGANTPSIAEFKRRFSPALVPYHAARRTPSRTLRLARAVRGLPRS